MQANQFIVHRHNLEGSCLLLIFFCTTIINDTHVYIKLEWFRDAHSGGGQHFCELELNFFFIILKASVANAGHLGYFWPIKIL